MTEAASNNNTRQRASKLRLMAFDVDGVMTDGSIYYTDAGTELKAFHAHDGAGLKQLENAGITVAIITGRQAACVEARMRNLQIQHLYQGVKDKVACLQTLLDQLGLNADQAGYMGDDIMDLGAMTLCGFSAAPANAHPRAMAQAGFVTQRKGGAGAVREVCDFILESQNLLDEAIRPWLHQ